MNIKQWLDHSTKTLEKAGVPTARLDSMVLLEDELGVDKIKILSDGGVMLLQKQLDSLNIKLKERYKHVPLAFIRGKTEFFGREFKLNKNVLEPRPESETMIENLLKISGVTDIIDVGTGSGALAITAKLELPEIKVAAMDIDPNCLEVARQNAKLHKTDIEFVQGDLLAPFIGRQYKKLVLLANLPYVPDHYQINQAATNEPRLAIFGGQDGLELYMKMFKQLSEIQADELIVLTESLPFQHYDLKVIGEENGYRQTVEDDFIQRFDCD